MTATLHRLGAGRDAGLYYTSDPNREVHNRDEYYAADGGGVWHSTGQTIVADGAAVTVETFRDLCAGIDPRSGKPLVRGAGEKHRAGVDMTFTPGKSISVLWMSGDQTQRQQIEAAHRVAVTRALKFLHDEGLVVVRHGAGGVHRAKPSDLIVARFDHFTTRAGDPNIHSHCVVINVAGSPVTSARYAAQHLTTETDQLFRAQRLAGSVYRAAISEQLAKSGFVFRPAGQSQFEIAGLPQELLEVFSKRSHDIENLVGRGASAAQKEVAALGTRTAKANVLTGAALEAVWQHELAQTGLDPWQLAEKPDMGPIWEQRDAVHDRFAEPAAVAGASPVPTAASALFLTESVLERNSLLEAAFVAASLRGIGPDAVYAELAQLEAAGALLRLDETHWTTPEIAATEAEMLRAADRPMEHDWIRAEALTAALQQASHLSVEQADAVRMSSRADGVSLIEAGAGTGKTTLAKALVAAAELSGMTVIGLAPSWIAADELGTSTGIATQAVAKWRFDQANGVAQHLTAQTLILLDEAGMVGTRDMAAVLVAAKAAGAKVVLMGDRRQIQSVAGASALSAIADVLDRTAVLDAVRRQRIEWQRAASTLMARGDAEAGFRAYARHDQIELVHGETAAHDAVIGRWTEAGKHYGDDVLIVTRRNIDAIALNAAARAALRQSGAIEQAEVILPSIGRDDKARDISISVGDKLRFGETVPDLGIRNGTRAQIQAVGPDAGLETVLQLRLENGPTIDCTWSDLARPLPGRKGSWPRVSHAYAGTAYSAQGRTAAATILYIGQKTDAREIYVGLTRHQHAVHIVVEADRLEASCRQRQEDPRVQPTRTAVLERLFAEVRHYREKANVVDFVGDRGSFIVTGVVRRPETDGQWTIRSTLRAALQLSLLVHSVKGLWHAIGRLRSGEPARSVELPSHFAALRQTVRRRDQTPQHRHDGPVIER